MCCWLCDLFKHDSHVIIPEAEPMGCLPSTLNFCVCQVGNVFQLKSTECSQVSFCLDLDYYLDVPES